MSESTANKDGIFSMIKLGLILAVYAAASCTVLALVNNVTSPVIKLNQLRKAKNAMEEVISQADDFADIKGFVQHFEGTVQINDLKFAKKDGQIIGAVCQVTGPTYETSSIMVGMLSDGTLTGMRYLSNKDTPGFGLKGSDATYKLAGGKTFYEQFAGLSTDEPLVAKKNFDAISGATITSNGIASLLNVAVSIMKQALAEVSHE